MMRSGAMAVLAGMGKTNGQGMVDHFCWQESKISALGVWVDVHVPY